MGQPCKNLVDEGFCFCSGEDGTVHLHHLVLCHCTAWVVFDETAAGEKSLKWITWVVTVLVKNKIPCSWYATAVDLNHSRISSEVKDYCWLVLTSIEYCWLFLTWTIPLSPPWCSWCGKPRRQHPPQSVCNSSCPPCGTWANQKTWSFPVSLSWVVLGGTFKVSTCLHVLPSWVLLGATFRLHSLVLLK